MKSVVCIVSYQRPAGLSDLLAGIDGLRFDGDASAEMEVVVVDNDANESARSIVQSWAARARWGVHYRVEPKRGICRARNRAIQEARRIGAGLVAFIDDDEVPAPDWFQQLHDCLVRFESDSVIGAVVPRFIQPPPAWIIKSGFFQRPRVMTGTPAGIGRTGNMLARMALFDAVGGFDERFDTTGGGDTHLALKAKELGFRCVFCDEAVVYESVPPGRANARWLFGRFYRIGNSWAAVRRLISPGLGTKLLLFARGISLIVVGTVLLPLGIFGRGMAVRFLGGICRGMGILVGILGYRYQEYSN